MTRTIEISIKTLITFTVFILALWMVFLIKDVLVLLFIAFILKCALSPLVIQLEERNMPRVVAIGIVYVLMVTSMVLIIGLIVPGFVRQIVNLINDFPYYLEQLSLLLANVSIQNQSLINSLSGEAANITSNLFLYTVNVFSVIVSFITVLVVAFYLLVEEDDLKQRLRSSLPGQYRDQVIRILTNVEARLGAWVRGQLVLSIIVSVMYFIGLSILGIENALALALLGGVLEIIPFIGAFLAAIPAILIALSTGSPILTLLVIALYVIVQQLHNNITVPKVMEKATGLSPLVILVAILIGQRIWGITGILIAIPFAVVVQVILFDMWGISRDTPQALVHMSEMDAAKDRDGR